MIKFLSVMGVLMLLNACCSSSETSTTTKIDAYVQEAVRVGGFSGSVLVAQDGKILLSKGYGLANRECNAPNKPETKFQIASITKPFTALAIIQLQEKGLLSVQDTLNKYIPDYPQGDKITLHQMLSHTSGIGNIVHTPHFDTLKNSPIMLEQEIALIKSLPMEFAPGQKHNYSNSNYIVLTYIIEKVSGMSYEDYLVEHIFKPLGMHNSGYAYNRTILKNRASGYTCRDGVYYNATYLDMSWASGSGGLYSTVEDLYAWDQGLYGDKLLKQNSLKLLFASHATMADQKGYGYGWELATLCGKKVAVSLGQLYGVATRMVRFIDDNAVIIILGNQEGVAQIEEMCRDIAALLIQKG